MKILVFTEGTVILYRERKPSGDAPTKLWAWKRQGAEIGYLTSRRTVEELDIVRGLLREYDYPPGELFYRGEGEEYKDVAERVLPDILIEDDCASIGGAVEMTYTFIKPEVKARIKSIVVKEGGGIDHLPDQITELTSKG